MAQDVVASHDHGPDAAGMPKVDVRSVREKDWSTLVPRLRVVVVVVGNTPAYSCAFDPYSDLPRLQRFPVLDFFQ